MLLKIGTAHIGRPSSLVCVVPDDRVLAALKTGGRRIKWACVAIWRQTSSVAIDRDLGVRAELAIDLRQLVAVKSSKGQVGNVISSQINLLGFSGGLRCILNGHPVCETRIREETKATCRAIPLTNDGVAGRCLVCGEAAAERAYFAKAY